nr:MAG TPA: hypothetical protein [Caudoviricetes sp.]
MSSNFVRHFFPPQAIHESQREYLPGQAVGNIRYVALEPGALIYALRDFSLDYSFEIRYLRYAAFKCRLRVWIARHAVVIRRPRTEQICPQLRKPLTVKFYLFVKVVQLRQLFKRHLTASSRVLSCFSISGLKQCLNGHRGFSPPVWTRNTQCSFGHISGTAITSRTHFCTTVRAVFIILREQIKRHHTAIFANVEVFSALTTLSCVAIGNRNPLTRLLRKTREIIAVYSRNDYGSDKALSAEIEIVRQVPELTVLIADNHKTCCECHRFDVSANDAL